jgi:hypothetical protein
VSERIEKLKDRLEREYHCKARHVASTPLFEGFGGKMIWEGVVETFDLEGYPKAKRCYAFPFIDNDEPNTRAGRIIFEIPPVNSPESAVKVAIAEKARRGKTPIPPMPGYDNPFFD